MTFFSLKKFVINSVMRTPGVWILRPFSLTIVINYFSLFDINIEFPYIPGVASCLAYCRVVDFQRLE